MRIEFLIPWRLNVSESEQYCDELRVRGYNVRLGGADMSVLRAANDHRTYRMRFGDRYFRGSKNCIVSILNDQRRLIPYVVQTYSFE